MRVRGTLVLGSVLVLLHNVLGQVAVDGASRQNLSRQDVPLTSGQRPVVITTVDDNVRPVVTATVTAEDTDLRFPASLSEVRSGSIIDHGPCVPLPLPGSDCHSTCTINSDCKTLKPGLSIECIHDKNGCCNCLDHYQCLSPIGANCEGIRPCHSETECPPGYICRQNITTKCCQCIPRSDCVPNLKYPTWWYCPNTCASNRQCSDGRTCQQNPCGGCHCYLKHEQPKDCCYDSSSGCEKNECATHHDCKHGKVCVPDPNCTGGCICDPGEGCMNTGGPDCLDNECVTDRDCKPWGPHYFCSKSLCGGCRCVEKKQKDCCPDFLRPPWCPVDCEYDEQCQRLHGKLAFCGRRKCGGCKCDLLYSPAEYDCFHFTKPLCPNPCRKHSECPLKTHRCQKDRHGCCQCLLQFAEGIVEPDGI